MRAWSFVWSAMGSVEKLALSEIHFRFCRSLSCVHVLASGLSANCWAGVNVLQPNPEKVAVSDRGACAALDCNLAFEAVAAGGAVCAMQGCADKHTTETMAQNMGTQFFGVFENEAV